MLELAQSNASKAGATNASFVESSITSIPLPDDTANCIISNCVVNLVPAAEKPVAFQEMFRLLAPGGRVAISDILTRKPLPDVVAKDLSLYVGCIASASQIHEYEQYLRDAGFKGMSCLYLSPYARYNQTNFLRHRHCRHEKRLERLQGHFPGRERERASTRLLPS